MINRFKLLLRVSLFWVVLFITYRILFLAYNSSPEQSVSGVEFLTALLYGLRMDISLTGYVIFFLSLMFALSTYTRFSGKILVAFNYILIPIAVILLSVDLIVFSFWHSHFDSSAFIYMDRIEIVTRSLTFWQSVLSILFMGIYISLVVFAFRKIVVKYAVIHKTQKWFFIPVWLFVAATMIIPVRGGLQHIPMNTGVAYFSNKEFANMIAVNPIWNFAYSLKRYDKLNASYNYLESEEANTIFEELYALEGDRKIVVGREKPNVVIVILEGFAEGSIGYKTEGKEVSPRFSALRKEGIYFNNIYGTNTRSDKGLVGILSGTPVLPGISLLKYPQKSKTLTFLTKKLRNVGYDDQCFIYGGDINFANMNSYMHLAGFNKIVSKSDFPSKYYNKKWGVHDEYTFDFLLDEIKGGKSSFLKVLFTLSSHEPFDVPMDRVLKDDYLNSVYYTDKCIGDFIDKAKQLPNWENTIYVFLSDHSSGWPSLPNSYPERYHMPMLWLGGALSVKDTVVTKVGSQTDMVTSLLNQLAVNSDGFKFSKDLFNQDQEGFAFFNHNGGFFFVDKNMKQYFDITYDNFLTLSGATSRKDSLKAKAYIQVLYEDYEKR